MHHYYFAGILIYSSFDYIARIIDDIINCAFGNYTVIDKLIARIQKNKHIGFTVAYAELHPDKIPDLLFVFKQIPLGHFFQQTMLDGGKYYLQAGC